MSAIMPLIMGLVAMPLLSSMVQWISSAGALLLPNMASITAKIIVPIPEILWIGEQTSVMVGLR